MIGGIISTVGGVVTKIGEVGTTIGKIIGSFGLDGYDIGLSNYGGPGMAVALPSLYDKVKDKFGLDGMLHKIEI